MSIALIILLLSIVFLVYLYKRQTHNIWHKRNIPYIKPEFFWGNLRGILFFHKCTADIMRDFYNDKIAKNQPIVGLYNFHNPALLIRDLNLVKNILMKDFNSFSNRFISVDAKADVLNFYNIFFLKNPEWKEVRSNITPVFTSGKIKQMFSLIYEIGNQLDLHISLLKPDPETGKICMEMKNLCSLYTTDVIASVAFGIQANSITNPNGEFRANGRKIFDFTVRKAIDFGLISFQPYLAKFFRSTIFSPENTKFLKSAIRQAIETREKSGILRNDLIDVLVELKKSPLKSDPELNMNILVAQAAIFFTAGFETTSSAMAFSLYEIAKDEKCQERLREEIQKVLEANNGEGTYDALQSMEYLHMVVSEIFRLYPALPVLNRECTAPEGYSLKPQIDYVIPYGMPVFIPNYAIHRDPEYFPDPDKFDPERFSPENRGKLVPYSYMPFGLGPHNCIGARLGILQVKIGLISLLRNHYVKLAEKTSKTMQLHNMAFLIQSAKGIHCEIVHDPLLK